MNRALVIILILLSSYSFSQKMNGISVNGEKFKPNFNNFSYLSNSNANWVSIQAFCFVTSPSSGVDFNRENFWYSQTIEGITKYIQQAKKNKFKVFLKPHTIAEYNGVWSGTFGCSTEKDWKKLEDTYSTYILSLAKIAEENKVEAFSIGVELKKFFSKRNTFVNQLIKDVKAIYHGKLTYCANWDEFISFNHWGQLSFIGIDSYFSISAEKTPNIEKATKSLIRIKKVLKKLSVKHNKMIVFTEFGFQSKNYAGHNPWKWVKNSKATVNLEAQAICYQAVFESFWKESWFLGGFSWKWHLDYRKSGGNSDNSYTPQNKPAEKVISSYYSKNKK